MAEQTVQAAIQPEQPPSSSQGKVSEPPAGSPSSSYNRRPVRFIHAADLHLAAAFRGVSGTLPAEASQSLREATFVALERLFALAEAERPDMLLLAGDIYNAEDYSVKAHLALHAGCVRMARLGIRVFIVHGNHDPLSSRLQSLEWPENVQIFGEALSSHRLHGNDENLLAVVHGISYANASEPRNLAALFARGTEETLHIGLLHTTATEREGSRYAPASLDDFTAAGMDYWALGHVHQHKVLLEHPLVQYPGSIQGLHINETGPHGCLLVTATPEGRGYQFVSRFCTLSPVVWLRVTVELEEGTSLDALEARMRKALEEAVAPYDAEAGYRLVLVRMQLKGRTFLDPVLRKSGTLAELAENLREESGKRPLVWIKDIELATRACVDSEALLQRPDLLGETWRFAQSLKNDPEALLALRAEPLGELYGDAKAKKVLEPLSAAELTSLLGDAEALCLDLLESE